MKENEAMKQPEEHVLPGGERFLLEDDNTYIELVSGALEAYAVTSGDLPFRRMYLGDLAPGDCLFAAMDEFRQVEFQVCATEDASFRVVSLASKEPAELLPLMRRWFQRLVALPWLRMVADQGDDLLQTWRRGTVLPDSGTQEELLAAFRDNEGIFSMLLGVRVGSENVRLARRMKVRERSKRVLVENGIRCLMGEERIYGLGEEAAVSREAEDAAFAVQSVARALSMPAEGIHITASLTGGLDEVAILRRLVQKGNMQMRLVTLEKSWYTSDAGVLIGFYQPPDAEEKIVAALLPVDPEHYRMVTREQPEGVPVTEEVARHLQRDAFICHAGFPTRKLGMLDLLKFMFTQCWTADYRTILLCSLLAGMIPLVMPIITEMVFQDIIPILDRQGLATVTQTLMVTGFTMASLSIVRSIAIMRISTRIELSAEAAMWGRLMSLPTSFFRRFTSGELASRMQGLGVAKSLASGQFVESVFSFLFSFWSVFLMCWYSIKLTAAAVGVWIVYSLFIALVMRRTLYLQRQIIATGNRTAGTVQQIFAALARFRVQGAEEQAYHLWARDFGENWNWSLRLRWLNNYTGIIGSIQPFILNLILYLIAVYGMGETQNGKVAGIGYAQFIAFSAAYSSFNEVMGGLVGFVGQYFTIQPQIENLRPIMEETPENGEERKDAGKLTGQMEVHNLSFGYPDPETGKPGKEILHNVSFSVRAGENVAIVGPSGSGKSTLVRLLLGFEAPKKGSIFFDGHDLSELSLPSVRSQMGVVLQNGQLMTGDIYSNIVGTKLLPQETAWQAAEAAGIADDIAEMPMGMQTMISEGSSNISGGQRQRLLIARALVAKPPILIFDEATSALDNRSQAIVTKSLDELKSTRIIVAHRLSTIRGCDRVIVMEQGRIAEMGSFEELMAKGGLFASLVRRQVA